MKCFKSRQKAQDWVLKALTRERTTLSNEDLAATNCLNDLAAFNILVHSLNSQH